ncbi:hypothetical protein TNCV_4711271 [Trichonephila clavipes]|uniref:Uncharacterized protein n=1 Tax=Trichonephila clavipes TaxID=2585209 RepID=A0A8X6RWY3_TRICX|nr:hypothetical protein TNCV_4711271 [Trichonephila clavipes]
MYQQCVLEGCGSEIQFHPNYDTGCRTNVVMYNVTVQQPFSRCSMYQQCVLEGCGSGINSTQTIIPGAGPMWSRITTVQQSLSRCSMYQQCVLEGCGSEIQFHPNYDTGCRTNVVMYNATVQQPLSRCSMYQQCVLEVKSNSTQTMIPGAGPMW